jgi:hypothetical protein
MARRKRAGARRRTASFKWLRKWWPSVTVRKRWMRAFSHTPATLQFVVLGAVLVALWFGLNWIYQVVRKPSELFFPVSGVLYKMPAETWDTYESAFRKHSTSTISPAFLAALAQIEASGNPIARTYWRWSLTESPFDLYRPASSAVGMYQLTTVRSRRRGTTASTIMSSSRTARGTTFTRVGSMACIHASSPRIPSS